MDGPVALWYLVFGNKGRLALPGSMAHYKFLHCCYSTNTALHNIILWAMVMLQTGGGIVGCCEPRAQPEHLLPGPADECHVSGGY